MSQQPMEPPKLNMGRWLLWGFIAIVALAGLILFFTWLGNNVDETTVDTLIPQSGEQAEWTIDVGELSPSPGRVTLKGDLPTGFPTETWRDGEQMARSVGASFEWTVDIDPPLPTPVHEIDEIVADNQGSSDEMCGELKAVLETWAQEVAQALGEAQRIYSSAFAQHTLNTMVDNGCPTE